MKGAARRGEQLRLAATALLVLAAASCSSSKSAIAPAGDAGTDQDAATTPPWLQPFDPTPRGSFPRGFLWGSATSAYQIEGGLANTDWDAFGAAGHIAGGAHADDGPKSRQFYQADIQALVDSHQNAYRFGIEWARVFPTVQAWTACTTAAAPSLAACRAAASAPDLAYYHALLTALRMHGITPLVTLVHSSLPSYMDDLTQDWKSQGWMRDGIVGDLAAWASFAAGEFGGDVAWWVTLNEPLTNVSAAYIDGTTPPGVQNELDALVKGMNQMVRTHVAMYDAIHAVSSSAKVSITQDVHLYYGQDPNRPEDQASAKKYDYFSNVIFLEAIVRGNLDSNFDGTLGPGEPMNDPTLRGRVDYIGLNYYGFSIVHGVPGYPIVAGESLPDQDDHGLPKNDLGWDIYPRGFGEALDFAASYGVPIVVTENGLADAADTNRPRFVAEHLAELAAKIQGGAAVLGYFHWATIDNFEWNAGFCPRFGLYAVDYGDPMRARSARGSAGVYRQIIDAAEVSDTLLAGQPAYATPSTICASGP